MPQSEKIATCSYCGTRAVLVFRGTVQHELSCGSCGAPLHEMKRLRAEPAPRKRANGALPGEWQGHGKVKRPRKFSKKRSKKSLTRRFFEEAFDVLEDIFD